MQVQSTAVNEDLQKRLRRIEGQVRGIQRMVADARNCREIVQQLNAAESALKNATHQFMRAYAKECLMQTDEMGPLERNQAIDEIVNLMAKV